jgi:copper chaperone NosL
MNALRALAAGALLVACATNDAATEPVWGKQPCAHCSMLLSDRRFGAQLVSEGGDRRFFDDVGCMVVYVDERGIAPSHAWVRDAETGRWLDARVARYATGASSPMGFGFEAHAATGVDWEDMRASVLAQKRSSR